jgi:hypothetical protein
MRTWSRWILLLIGVLLIASLSACGGGQSTSPLPTQTPIYVVVTDTPEITASEEVEGDSEAGSDTESAESEVDSEPQQSEIVELPAPFMCKAEIVEQTYENGFMFWIGASTEERCTTNHTYEPGSGEIWVAVFEEDSNVGDWLIFVDDWDEDIDIEYDPDLDPPDDDLIQPMRGFGKVWREGLTEDRQEELGWADAPEFQFAANYRYDPGGYLDEDGEFVSRPGVHRLEALGGEQFFFDEISQMVFYIPPEE